MSAEILRRAASLMREQSHDAAEAWGGDAWSAGQIGYDDRQGTTYDVHSRGTLVAATGCEELSIHIASWHPAVALAVADWLDTVAAKVYDADLRVRSGGEYEKGCDCGLCDPLRSALAVARAYLGEDA